MFISNTGPPTQNINICELRNRDANRIVVDCWGILDESLAQKLGFDYIKLGCRKCGVIDPL